MRYNGDTDYLPSLGVCEPLAVGLTASVVTEIHDDADHSPLPIIGVAAVAAAGKTVHDAAMVSGSGPTPTGTADFTFFPNPNDDCTPSIAEIGAGSAVLVSGTGDGSDAQGPLAAGRYSFKALYNGDGTYFPAESDCEPLTVVDVSLSQAISTNDRGTSHTVTATVTDGTDPVAGVTVLWVVTGLNAAVTGDCSVNAGCTTDAGGNVSFTYTDADSGPYPDTDTITACVDIDAVPGTCDTADATNSVTKSWIDPG